MTPCHVRPLHIAIVAALVLCVLAPVASAQDQVEPDPNAPLTFQQKRAQRLAKTRGEAPPGDGGQQANEVKKPALYPNATRVSPPAQVSGKLLKQLQSLHELYEKQDMAGVMAKADEIAAMPTANSYDKSFAYSMAANAAVDQDDKAKAADYFKKAIESNGLDNDGHFSAMSNLAVIQFQQEKYQDALATIDRFILESKSGKPEQLGFRAGLLANLGRNDEAVAAYKQLLEKNPNDKSLLMNAVATLQSADKFDQANTLMEDAYKRGMLTDSKELRALYVGYLNAGRLTDAKAVMEAGTSKGIVEASPQLAKDYMVLAQNAYAEDMTALAIEMYSKAGPMAENGDAYLNLAKVLLNSGKKAEAKAAAKKALDKGLKNPDQAKLILST